MTDDRIAKALTVGISYGQTDGDHHKTWVIDQMIRCLTGCPEVEVTKKGYTFKVLGESQEYIDLIRESCVGDFGPDSYEWDIGIPP